jgi:putative transposase
MRFRLIDAAKKDFPVQRLCKVLDVSASGYVAGAPGLPPTA